MSRPKHRPDQRNLPTGSQRRRQYPGSPACRSPAAWPSGSGGAPAPARRRRPAQRRRAGADPRLAVARLPGLQWGMSSLHKLLRCWKRQRPDVLYIATEGPLGFSALRARAGHPGGQRFPHQLPAVQRALRLGPLTRLVTGYLRWFHNRTQMTLVPSGSQRHGIATARFRTPQPALPRGRQPTLPSLPARSRTTPALGPGRTGHRRAARRPAGGGEEPRPARRHLPRALRRPSAAEAAPGTGGRRAGAQALEQDLPEALFCGVQRGETLAAHYASGDLFLFPSLSETAATWSSKPRPPASRWSPSTRPPPASIRHGHNGVLAAPGDKSGFVEVASWLLDDQERLRRVRLNARQHASRQGWDSIVEHFQNYLEDACASPLVQPARSKPERPPAEDGGARSRE